MAQSRTGSEPVNSGGFRGSLPDAFSFAPTCMATGKSFCASGGKKTSTAFFGNGWFPVGGVPTSMMCSLEAKATKFSHTDPAEVNSMRHHPDPACRFCCKSYFSSRLSTDSEAEQSRLLSVSLHLELCEPGGVSLDGLRHLSVHRVELHGSDNAVLLRSREQSTLAAI